MRYRADLHTHTYFSDGLLSPSDAVTLAIRNGVQLLAVTDHDNMLGCAEVADVCRQRGILSVKALEVSAYLDTKIHVLGYALDDTHPAYVAFAKRVYDGSWERAYDVLAKLKKAGVSVSLDDVLRERRCPQSPLHTMYIARACTRRGYASSAPRFYLDYLNQGKVGYSNVGRPTPQEAVQVITQCGGFASLAHPGRINMEKQEVVDLVNSLCEAGLGGIEAVYSAHTVDETAYYKELAKQKHLLVTGGSDTHVDGGNRAIGKPEFYAEDELLARLKII